MDILSFDAAAHMEGLRECVIELQDYERSIDQRMPQGIDIVDDYVEQMRQRCATADGRILVACVAGEVAGFATVLAKVSSDEIHDGDHEYGLVSDLVVKAKFRERGFGRQLLTVAEAFARKSGATVLRIGVLADNPVARDLYKSAGFSTLYVEVEKSLAGGATEAPPQFNWSIETERLRLEPVTVDDAELLLAVWNDPAFIEHVTDRGIRTLEQARDAIEDGAQASFTTYGHGPCSLSLKSDGSKIGICGLFRRDNLDDPDIGFSVLPDFCGQGFASEAAFAIIDRACAEMQLDRVTAIVSPKNVASIGLIEKLGLRFERMITMPGDDEEICLYGRDFTGQD